jgi:hypothetical protein
LLALAVYCVAAPVREATVAHQDNRYSVRVDADVHATSERLLALLTDFDHLDRIDETIVASERLYETADGAERVRFQVLTCILFFCFNLTQEADFRIDEQGVLVGTIDPAASDLDYGHVSWQLDPMHDEERTYLVFRAQFEPAFWIPPFIGPWLLERRLREVATSMVVNLNDLAEAATSTP